MDEMFSYLPATKKSNNREIVHSVYVLRDRIGFLSGVLRKFSFIFKNLSSNLTNEEFKLDWLLNNSVVIFNKSVNRLSTKSCLFFTFLTWYTRNAIKDKVIITNPINNNEDTSNIIPNMILDLYQV